MATGSLRARTDLGRLIMVPVAALILILDSASLTHQVGGGVAGELRWLGTAGICAYYALLIWAYLRRGPAVATTRSMTARVAAVVATWTPFAFPLLRTTSPGTAKLIVADMLLLAGTAWSVWSLRFLGRNLSVLAQARDIVDHGPYRWIRHPLYAGEIVSCLGLAITAGSAAAIGLWLTICALQGYRALREEQVLLQALPGYRAYRTRTAALLPGIF